MFEHGHQIQLAILSAVISLMTVACFIYILWQQPQSLRTDRNGLPFFVADVIHPDTGEAIPLERLIEHYKADL